MALSSTQATKTIAVTSGFTQLDNANGFVVGYTIDAVAAKYSFFARCVSYTSGTLVVDRSIQGGAAAISEVKGVVFVPDSAVSTTLSISAVPVSEVMMVTGTLVSLVLPGGVLAGETTRVSVASDGTQGNGGSSKPSISGDGRFVAFESMASNLVPGVTNGTWDVFVHDRQTGVTERVSMASDGTQGNGGSSRPSISADGRFVAFDSYASNLVPGDTNDDHDIFVHDRQTGVTELVSMTSDGTQGDNDSYSTSISGDGRFVAFGSWASNLVPGDTNASPSP